MQAMKKWMMVAAATAVLAACGGGGDDAGEPALPPGTLKVANSTRADFNGRYPVTATVTGTTIVSGTPTPDEVTWQDAASKVKVEIQFDPTAKTLEYLRIEDLVDSDAPSFICNSTDGIATNDCPAGVVLTVDNRALSLQNARLTDSTGTGKQITVDGALSWPAP